MSAYRLSSWCGGERGNWGAHSSRQRAEILGTSPLRIATGATLALVTIL